jgi:hypothetical protein
MIPVRFWGCRNLGSVFGPRQNNYGGTLDLHLTICYAAEGT